MKRSPNDPCPCGRPLKFKRCCQRLHRGSVAAATPEELMRSRYAAYAVGDVSYILATTHPESPHAEPDAARWRANAQTFCRVTTFNGLDVLDAPPAEGDEGTVTFRATLVQGGRDASFTERSVFRRVEGRWLYLSGDFLDTPP